MYVYQLSTLSIDRKVTRMLYIPFIRISIHRINWTIFFWVQALDCITPAKREQTHCKRNES